MEKPTLLTTGTMSVKLPFSWILLIIIQYIFIAIRRSRIANLHSILLSQAQLSPCYEVHPAFVLRVLPRLVSA